MKLKNVFLLLVVVLLVLLLREIGCIANYNQVENLISDEDRRAADAYNLDQSKAEANKRGLYETSGSHNRHQTYPSGYGEATFSNPGYAYTPSSVTQYYPVPSYSSGHGSYGLFGQSAQGGGYGYGQSTPAHGYGHSASAQGYGHSTPAQGYGYSAPAQGYGHSAPAQGHGHGHGGLALKGLLIPLAGIALLGAAAALSTNPVLLQLGVVNGRRRRRRRAVAEKFYPNPREN